MDIRIKWGSKLVSVNVNSLECKHYKCFVPGRYTHHTACGASGCSSRTADRLSCLTRDNRGCPEIKEKILLKRKRRPPLPNIYLKSTIDELARARAKTNEAVNLLRRVASTEPCELDHHGYCQSHGWLCSAPCPQGVAKEFLKQFPISGDNSLDMHCD